MSRFLFVAPPLTGHVNPALAVAGELTDRGHEVAWCGPESFLRPLVGPAVTVFPTGLRLYRPQAARGMRAVKSLWERFVVPFARFILAPLDQAVREYQPDVLAVDQHAVAGALVAHRHGLPWATLAPQAMELTEPLRRFPRVDAWIHGHLDRLWRDAGLPGTPPGDLRFSPYLTVAFTGTALTGPHPFPDHFALVGPAVAARRDAPDFPWSWLDGRRQLVLVTVGTLSEDIAGGFYSRMMAALAPLGDWLQAVLVVPPEALPEPPAHVLVRRRVPVLDLLPHTRAVVCHGGLNTVCEALAQAVPLVIAPIRDDQPVIASQVVAAGAGERVPFGRATPLELRQALCRVLDVPGYTAAARRVAAQFAAAGGTARAADRLEQLARSGAAPAGSGQTAPPVMSGTGTAPGGTHDD